MATAIPRGRKTIASVLDYHVELKSAEPYGEVLDDWIRLRAPLVSVSLTEMREQDGDKLPPGSRSTRLKTVSGSQFSGKCKFDSARDYDNGETRTYVMNKELFALVLTQREGNIEHN